jgi:hypothetical protein
LDWGLCRLWNSLSYFLYPKTKRTETLLQRGQVMLMKELAIEKLKDVMKQKGYVFFTNGDWNLNLIGIRGESRVANSFDDTLLCIHKEKNKWCWYEYKATTDAGTHWLKNPMNIKGTALLVPNQYRGAYKIDKHRNSYFALCQRKEVSVYRDSNKDNITDFNPSTIDKGLFGINIHRSNPNKESSRVEKWSAGCQVFAKPDEFDNFMIMAQKSASIWGNSFTYTLLTYKDLEI